LNALWYYAVGFIIIWIIAILFRKQLKINIEGPLLMRRTKRLRGFIDGMAQRSTRFWKWTMNIGIPVGFFFMLLMLYLLIISLQTLLQAPSVGLILPGVDIPGQPIFIPLGYGLIGLATVIIVHEFAHGILARVEGVRIKSIGVLLLAILPGAFVEPDEEEVKKVSRLAKLRIYVAGSISNLILALVSLLIITTLGFFAIGPAFHPDGMQISSVVPKSPAEGVLQQGMVIQSINGHPTTNTLQYLQSMNNTKIGDTLTFQTNQGTYRIKTTTSPNNASKAYVGIRSQENLVLNSGVSQIWGNSLPWILFPLRDLFYWIFILNFLIGTFNLLPMKPLDGGIMLEELLRYKLSEERAHSVMYPLSLLIVAIIVVSVVYGTGRGLMMLL
jgi:membrane-associated protease RseP (regulator of RpoE activity)